MEKWQRLLDMTTELMEIPVALIMRLHPETLEVLLRSNNNDNVYHKGEHANLGTGLYCETVMESRRELIISNALKDPKWMDNPDIALNMISYMGFPILWPTGEIFGTICVLDSKERIYTEMNKKLLGQFAELIQDDLKSMLTQQRLLEEATARTLAEAELRESEEKFRKLFLFSPTPITIMTLPDGMLLDVNDAYLRVYGEGKTRADFVGHTTAELKMTGSPEKRANRLKRMQEQDTVPDEELSLILPDGQVRNVIVSSQKIEIAGVDTVITTLYDITQERKSATELQRVNERISLATRAGGIGIWDWDIDGNQMIWDDRMCQIYGIDPEKASFDAWKAALHPEDLEKALADSSAALEDDVPYDTEFRIVKPDGSIAYIKADGDVIRDTEGKPLRMIGVNQDITLRKKMEQDLIASEAQYKSLFQHNFAAKLLVDVDTGDIVEANKAACVYYGFTPEEFKTKKVWDINVVGEEFVREKLRESYNNRSNYVETKHRKADGTIADVAVFSGFMDIDERKMVYAIILDITERKALEREKILMEAQLLQKQKLESIGLLAGGVAHEINNPVFGIINYAKLISDKKASPEQVKEYSNEIAFEGQRIAEIVSNLLNFSRQEKHTHSLAEMSDIINHTVSLVQTIFRQDQIALEIDIQPGLPKISCRSQQIQQVVMNLITNARSALNAKYKGYDENKKITIRCNLETRDGKDWIVTVVEDYGTGIKKEIMNKIFDPFFTTKSRDEGTGLGLSISHGIVEGHNGTLTYESVEGEYTKAILALPV
jgi:PAS domain S-box-containing protein